MKEDYGPKEEKWDLDGEENESEQIIEYIEHDWNIFKKVFQIVETGQICLECLGRQFSYLGTGLQNSERAKSLLTSLLMECHRLLRLNDPQKKYLIFNKNPLEVIEIIAKNTNFEPAKLLYIKYLSQNLTTPNNRELSAMKNNITNEQYEGKTFNCILCHNILSEKNINNIVQSVYDKIKDYDFHSYLIGTQLDPQLSDAEDEFRSKYGISHGESFKKNINRLIGRKLLTLIRRRVDYLNPDINVILKISVHNDYPAKIDIKSNSLYIKGRYYKFVRNLPQTRWYCFKCRGSGKERDGSVCSACNGTGLEYSTSIEQKIENVLLKYTYGTKGILHGAGREDIDVRCLGNGRPFIFEVKNPIKRNIDLNKIEREINSQNEGIIKITNLTFSSKEEVSKLKEPSSSDRKKYHALVQLAVPITRQYFNERIQIMKKILNDSIINQRTPLRVVHRRADITRKKKVYNIEAKFIDPVHIFFKIETQGGTYIKELISGDNFRTDPSIAKIFQIPMECVELDVIYII